MTSEVVSKLNNFKKKKMAIQYSMVFKSIDKSHTFKKKSDNISMKFEILWQITYLK